MVDLEEAIPALNQRPAALAIIIVFLVRYSICCRSFNIQCANFRHCSEMNHKADDVLGSSPMFVALGGCTSVFSSFAGPAGTMHCSIWSWYVVNSQPNGL